MKNIIHVIYLSSFLRTTNETMTTFCLISYLTGLLVSANRSRAWIKLLVHNKLAIPTTWWVKVILLGFGITSGDGTEMIKVKEVT